MDNIVKVNNISFEYITDEAKLKAIDNLSLDVKKGEFVAIIGHNGSGKSTLSKNLNAILMPTKEIFLLMIWILKKKKDYGI
ncbi:P-loop containing region of AAA domain protein [Clostridioides difficile DA00130]|nr:P-loop containing region of AAA domain protein [Clostridioides difficile DA00131]ERM44869.1 P-loop containing region of AAA domain protein [Clostridioides difficile DA00130]